MKKHASLLVLLVGTGLLLHPLVGLGQYTTKQSFETAGDTYTYTPTGGQVFTGSSATAFGGPNPSPPASAVASSGTRAYGVQNNTGSGTVVTTINFQNIAFTGSVNNFLTLRLAVFATNQNGGLSSAGSVVVRISTDGGSTFTPTLTVAGTSAGRNIFWDHSGTASATATFGTPQTFSATGTAATNYTFLRVNLPAGVTQVQPQIVATANDKTAIVLDEIFLSSNSPLPVELTAFDAQRQPNAVLLKWTTASEKNSARFEVQHSFDGRDYQTVGTVAAQGTSTAAHTYTFAHAAAPAGPAYYRLRQVDTDGSTAYSPVRAVAGIRPAPAYPSPARDQLTLSAAAVGQPFVVLSSLGQPLLSGTVPADGRLSVLALPAGSYFLRLGTGAASVTQRFLRHD